MITIFKSILAINPAAKCSVANDDIDNIRWDDGQTPISKEDILAKQTELQAEYDSLVYARAREAEYPPLKDFAEAYTEKEIGSDTTKWDAYVINYNKTRSDNPK